MPLKIQPGFFLNTFSENAFVISLRITPEMSQRNSNIFNDSSMELPKIQSGVLLKIQITPRILKVAQYFFPV